MEPHKDFAYFLAQATYDKVKQYQNSGQDDYGIDGRTICFVEETGKIYTHGGVFGGQPITYRGSESVLINGEHTISLNEEWLDEYLEDYKPQLTTGSITYKAGTGIAISNNTISVKREDLNIPSPYSLPIAKSNQLGGIKTNYVRSGNNYPVRIDSDGNAYAVVTVGNPQETGVTKEYVDVKVSGLENRLNRIVDEINWDDLFEEYGVKPNAGQEVDPDESTITQWVKDPENIALVWQLLTAADAKPSWVSIVAEKSGDWLDENGVKQIYGTQIKQLGDQISLIAGNFDANGDPISGKWSGIILTAEDENGKSIIDLAADEVIARDTIITPNLIATKISGVDLNLTGKVVATNADIRGKITATEGSITNCVIGNSTVYGDLLYGRIIGKTYHKSNSGAIASDAALTIIDEVGIDITFPEAPVEGQTIYIKHKSNTSSGGVMLRPANGQRAYMYVWSRDYNYDVDSSYGYSTQKQLIDSSYNPPSPSFYNMFDNTIHSYIYSDGIWYELSTVDKQHTTM